MSAFKPYADKPMTMSYYQVPARVVEDAEELTTWVRASIRVAARGRPRKARRYRGCQTPGPAQPQQLHASPGLGALSRYCPMLVGVSMASMTSRASAQRSKP